jgi:hypothetical protein
MGRVLLETWTSPSFIFIYLGLFLIICWQYKRLHDLSAQPRNKKDYIYIKAALVSALLGLLGGSLGSVLLLLLGTDLSRVGINQLWLAAVVLMFIKPRFLCFAYAAGVISVSSLLFGYPDISIPELMGLVAVLHMVESLLIMVNGPYLPVPVYVRKEKQICGGFNLQLFWPIPLLVLLNAGFVSAGPGGIEMPSWWPLLKGYGTVSPDLTYGIIPVLAVLGYGEVITARTPRRAARQSSLYLFLFSLGLLSISLLAVHRSYFLPLAALFSPLGHELVIWLGMREEKRPAIYVKPVRGIMVLDIIPGSQASRAGLKSGDIILNVNGETVNSFFAFQELLNCGWKENILEVKRSGRSIKINASGLTASETGIIPAPDHNTGVCLNISEGSIFIFLRGVWRRLIRK